jgi:hypothetical protein
LFDRWLRNLGIGFTALWTVGAAVRIAAVAMVVQPGDEALFARTLAVPLLLAAAGVVLCGPGRGLPERWLRVFRLAFLVVAAAAPFSGFAASYRGPLAVAAGLAGGVAVAAARRAVGGEGPGRGAFRAATACAAVLLPLCVVDLPLLHTARIGSLGVASAVPGLEYEQPEGWKPGYPRCVYRHNSLGFRDREHDLVSRHEDPLRIPATLDAAGGVAPPRRTPGTPSSARLAGGADPSPESFADSGVRTPATPRPRRVLLIGDSYVWGDGIADLDGTLGEQMRRAFEEAAPGQWDVFSDGIPGNGLYGYTTAAAAVSARFDPQWIVIGYLSPSDLDRYDLQYLLEREPRAWPLKNLFANLNAFQAIHETSQSLLWRTPADTAPFREMLVRLAADARAAGRTVVALDYSSSGFPGGWPEGIHAWCLPSRFADRTDGRNWIGGYDTHPTAAMDAELARLLVASVLAGGPSQEFACPAVATGKGGGP